MTSLNTYFEAMKPFAKSIQEKATKLGDAFDEKFKKTQLNISKWQPSTENPLGEIIVVPPSVSTSPPSSPVSPETSSTLTAPPQPHTVIRRRLRRSRRLDELETDNERKQQVNQCLNNIINEIIEKEDIEKCLYELIDRIITMDDFIKKTSILTEFHSLESINTNEDNSELSEIQSDLIDPMNPLDTSHEKSELCENSITRKLSEEHFHIDTCESSIQQPNTSDTISQSINSPVSPNVIDPPIVEISEKPIATIIKKEKRFPHVHCCSLPSDIIVSHMSCSSTYIYICTDQQLLFYAQVPEHHRNYPLQWYPYNLPAEQLIVSNSNRTIWRIFDKSIYLSSDTIKVSPLGNFWTELTFSKGESLLSVSITDQYGWYIKEDGSLWLIRIDIENQQPLNVPCPFDLNRVVCSVDKTGVTTSDGQILIRVGCTNDCPEGDGWIFVEHDFGLFNSFNLVRNSTIICIMDKKHRLWIHDWSCKEKFYEVLRNDEHFSKINNNPHLMDISDKFLCYTDCQEQIYILSNSLIGVRWHLIQKGTRFQRLTGAFSNEDYVWALRTDGTICSSNGQIILEKPRQAQYLTHASFVPNIDTDTILWSLDESCNIYVRDGVKENSQWEQLDQSQFDWSRRLVDIVCNTVGVWAVDDRGDVHFRHGHISNSQEFSFLNPAWISIPGEPQYHRSFAQIFCGPEEWMVYATDNKQTLYARIGIDDKNPIGTSWKIVEDCSALELAISEHTLWLLTSHGRIQCLENISLKNPIGTRSTTLPGRFNSVTVSTDDDQVWALYPPHHLFKLERLTILFEK